MSMRKTIETEFAIVSYDETDELKQKVFDKVIEFFKKHECFYGETIMQSDDPQIYAPDLLAEIADDIIKFDTTYKD